MVTISLLLLATVKHPGATIYNIAIGPIKFSDIVYLEIELVVTPHVDCIVLYVPSISEYEAT